MITYLIRGFPGAFGECSRWLATWFLPCRWVLSVLDECRWLRRNVPLSPNLPG